MSKPFRERNPVIIGLASVLVLALLLVAAFNTQRLPLLGGGTIYHANFIEAGGLESGDEVRLAGVRIGEVEDLVLDNSSGEVTATMRLETEERLGVDTGASIRVKTLLGDMFVALEPAGEGDLDPDDAIPSERTSSPFDVVQAFEGLAETAGELDTDQLADSMTTLADLVRETPEEFRGALDGLSRLSRNLAARDSEINSLLQNLERVSTVLADRDQDIIALMRDADLLFEALLGRQAEIRNLLVATSQLSEELTQLVRESREDLRPALNRLASVVDVLNKNDDNLDNALRLMAPFYRVFASTLGNGPWFDTFIQNFPPLPGLGGNLGPIGLPRQQGGQAGTAGQSAQPGQGGGR